LPVRFFFHAIKGWYGSNDVSDKGDEELEGRDDEINGKDGHNDEECDYDKPDQHGGDRDEDRVLARDDEEDEEGTCSIHLNTVNWKVSPRGR
jgi:hypothetical protein